MLFGGLLSGGVRAEALEKEICIVGWRPVGWRKEAVYLWSFACEGEREWWREGKEKRVDLGLSSSPTTVRKPERLTSDGSVGISLLRTPTSTFSALAELSIVNDQAFSVTLPDIGS